MSSDWSERVEGIFYQRYVDLDFIKALKSMPGQNHPLGGHAAAGIIDRMLKIDPADTEIWILLCRILNSAKFYRSDVRNALADCFHKGVPEATEARVIVMGTLLNHGYKFTPPTLEREKDIRLENPEAWRSAWFRSSLGGEFKRMIVSGK